MRSNVKEIQNVSADGYGHSGVRFVLEPRYLLEGFRPGHFVRMWPDKWKIKENRDWPKGEALYP